MEGESGKRRDIGVSGRVGGLGAAFRWQEQILDMVSDSIMGKVFSHVGDSLWV